MAVQYPQFGPRGPVFGPAPQQQPQVQQPPQSGVQSFLDFLGSPAGSAVTNMAGAGLSAYGQNQQQNANLKQNASQFQANAIRDQYNQNRNFGLQQAGMVASADPLGASQGFAQKQALMEAILPQLRNARSTPGDSGVAGAMGSRTGGLSSLLPEGGFDPSMITRLYGSGATMDSLAKRDKQILNMDASAPTTNMGSLFGESEAAPHMAQVQQWAQRLQQLQGAEKEAFEAQLNQQIQQMAKEEGGGGFWSKFAKIAGVVGAGVATVMTAGGASPLLAGAIGAGSGAVGAMGNHQNPLLGAIMGTVGSVGIPGLGGVTSGSGAGRLGLGGAMRQGLKSSVSNPALYGAILG